MDNKEVKSAIDKIVVPKEKVMTAIDQGIKMSAQGRKRKKKKVLAGSVAAALLGITVASGFMNPTMNKVLASTPIIGGIFQDFGDSMGIELANQNAVTTLNQSLTKNGVTVKLTSAYFDGNVVSITGFVNKSVEKGDNEKREVIFDVNFEHNRGDNDPWLNDQSTDIKNTDDGYNFQWKMEYPYKTIKENFTLPISIHSINGIKGEWNFNIPIQQENLRELAIHQEFNYPDDGIKINMDEILDAKASSSIIYQMVKKYKDDDLYIKKAVDDQGNVYRFGNGTALSESPKEDRYQSTIRREMTKLKADISSITFYPQLSVADPLVQQRLDHKSFVLKSKRSSLMLQVNNIKKAGRKLFIDYQFLGLNKTLSKHQLALFKNNLEYAFMLVDQKYLNKMNLENPVGPENHSISQNEVKIIDAKTAHFQSEFNLDGKQKIKSFKVKNTMLQFDFSSFIGVKELAPFTVELQRGLK